MQRAFAFFIWVIYQTGRLVFGLVIHPYRTVREIMRGRWFVPLVFLPTAILAWIFVTGRIAAWAFDVSGLMREAVGLLYVTFILSLFMWQGLLFYLGMRFWVGLRR